MTGEEALKVLETELSCVIRNDGVNCDRDCANCDLLLDTEDVVAGLQFSISLMKDYISGKFISLPIAPGTTVYEIRDCSCTTCLPDGRRSGTCPYKDDRLRCKDVKCPPYWILTKQVSQQDVIRIQKERLLEFSVFMSEEAVSVHMTDLGYSYDEKGECWYKLKEGDTTDEVS